LIAARIARRLSVSSSRTEWLSRISASINLSVARSGSRFASSTARAQWTAISPAFWASSARMTRISASRRLTYSAATSRLAMRRLLPFPAVSVRPLTSLSVRQCHPLRNQSRSTGEGVIDVRVGAHAHEHDRVAGAVGD
jgi:hypothetical protein